MPPPPPLPPPPCLLVFPNRKSVPPSLACQPRINYPLYRMFVCPPCTYVRREACIARIFPKCESKKNQETKRLSVPCVLAGNKWGNLLKFLDCPITVYAGVLCASYRPCMISKGPFCIVDIKRPPPCCCTPSSRLPFKKNCFFTFEKSIQQTKRNVASAPTRTRRNACA